MNILIFNSLYYPYKVGGAEVSVQLLAESLVANGHKVTIATLHDEDSIKKENINGVSIIRFPLRNLYWLNEKGQSSVKKMLWHFFDIFNLAMYRLIEQEFKGNKFDIVHTNNLCGFSVAIWVWANKLNLPIVHTTRDYYLLNPNSTLFDGHRNTSPKELKAFLFSAAKKRMSIRVKELVGISNYIADYHINNGFFKHAGKTIIYNSVKNDAIKKRKNLEQKTTLGFIGRIEKAKGIESFLDALVKSSTALKKIKIAGKGEPEYITYLKNKYASLRLDFLGVVEPEKFYPGIDYLVVPSLWNEPLGRVVIEAYTYGVPVIGSNRGGITEIISNGRTGFLFSVEKENSLVNIINSLPLSNSNSYDSLSKNAKIFSEKFSQQNVFNAYLEVYHRASNII